ncbi:MAG: four-carbon acid sugar kinase family protein [Chitinophagaceae bacterium]
MKQLLLAYYGDDFTGSTDALEFLCRSGAKTMLFIEPPTAAQLSKYHDLQAYGVAGKTRSLPPKEMEQVLLPAFEQMKASGAKHVHYKNCSTFDSAPHIGSIGMAIDCGATIFQNKRISVLGGTPALGRYCVFGNLFARMGIGSSGAIYRLDRHPSMSKHPVTPAGESDLRLHLQQQTNKKIGLIDMLQLGQPVEQWSLHLQPDESVVLVDALYDVQLTKIGNWLDLLADENGPQFSAGGSAVEMALGKYWNDTGLLNDDTSWDHPGKAAPLLVISGSCSPVTVTQINWAKANAFEEVIMDVAAVCETAEGGAGIESDAAQAIHYLQQGKSVIVHTGFKQTENLSSEKLGTALGLVAKKAIEMTGVRRLVISGGDTSSYAARALEIEAVVMIAPLVLGAPLCSAISSNEIINGLEINFKGGQVGGEGYFGVLLNGEL